jgi:hypothetical protein
VLAGAVAVACVVGAGPVLLLRLAGNPLPDRLPPAAEVVRVLTAPDDGRLLLWALSAVGWLAWAVLAGSVLLELAARFTGRRVPRMPGMAGPQRLAHLLVAAALAWPAAAGSSAAVAGQPAIVSTGALTTPPEPAATRGAVPEAEVPASALAGSGATGSGATGSGATGYEVVEGDWMWHIAGRFLGDESSYPRIAALNPHLAERYPDFPDHIRPGDRLRLPAGAYDRGPRPYAAGHAIAPVASPDRGGPPPDAVPPAPAPDAASRPGDAPPAPAHDPAQPAGQEGPTPVVVALLAGGVAAALAGAAALHRTRRARRAAAGTRVPAPAADLARLDHALRLLAAASHDPATRHPPDGHPGAAPGRLPDIGAVWIAGGDIHLVLARPHPSGPPGPFRVHASGGWVLPAAAHLSRPPAVPAALPTLVTVGARPGRHLLVHLARLGTLTITGPPRRCGDLLRHIAAELVHNPWSSEVEVTLAGFPPGQAGILASLDPGRVRGSAAGAGTWAARVLLAHQTGPAHHRVVTRVDPARAGGGSPHPPPGGTLTITGEGRVHASFLAQAEAVPAAALPEHLLAALADLVRRTAAADRPFADRPSADRTAAPAGATSTATTRALPPEVAAVLLADTTTLPTLGRTAAATPDPDRP